MKKQFRLTSEGIAELKDEHKKLVDNRGDLAEAIKTAREQGDLSENAEYQSAKAEQERVELRISEIEHILQNASIISKPKSGTKVTLGSTVVLKAGSQTKQFTVVGTVEADPLEGKISDESPIGKALLGKKEGETVEIKTPSETTAYKITKIS